MLSETKVKAIINHYLPRMRIRLIKMTDEQATHVGTEETILGVDDIGSIMVAWDTGSGVSDLSGCYQKMLFQEVKNKKTCKERNIG